VLRPVDFLVIPSLWYENSPLVLLTALASHTPVIISNVEGMTEFVEHGKNGLVFEMGSAPDLEQVLRALIHNPESASDLSRQTEYGRTTAVMVEETLAVYQESTKAAAVMG
jgi:glycosyltransferase involved in cell wall biosynthesis